MRTLASIAIPCAVVCGEAGAAEVVTDTGPDRALLFVYPDDAEWIREPFRGMGWGRDDATTDPATPQGVGNAAAAAVIAYRRDGSSRLGTAPGGDGRPYADAMHGWPRYQAYFDGTAKPR